MKSQRQSPLNAREAMQRAVGGTSVTNYPIIVAGFQARGIPPDDIRPRENVFTYDLWKQLGRQVRKGEHGVKVQSFISKTAPAPIGETRPKVTGRRRVTATVFHISQTDKIEGRPAPVALPAPPPPVVVTPPSPRRRPPWLERLMKSNLTLAAPAA